ncbi:hypothetical protein [Macrococcus capreoli]|uniref:hypothetical protein n=1 Tax=Macrococcus capreoli TaxID=2982690 RepID=UPI003EE5B8FA
MKKLMMFLIVFSIILTACEWGKEEKKEQKVNIQSGERHGKAVTSTVREKSKIEVDDKSKLGLAFLQKDVEKFMVSGKEILTGNYLLKVPPTPQLKKFHRLILSPVNDETIPKGIKVYEVYPRKSNFISFIAITDKETIIGGTQNGYLNVLDNNDFIKYNTKEMYQNMKNLSSLKEIINLIEIDEQPSHNRFDQEETITNQTAREKFYNDIMNFEGTKELDSMFIWDDIKVDRNNDFYVNYRNKELEILGTYRMVNGKLLKEVK